MSKTALVEALRTFDVERTREILAREPELKELRLERGGFDLLQFCCKRLTADDPHKAGRQLRMAKWLVSQGFDPRATYATEPDGDEESVDVSLVWFAVAKAQNTRLARYFLKQGARPAALYAAAWWGNAEIVPDLVKHGADLNERFGATPLHMAVDVVRRGTDGKPNLARRRLRLLREMLELGADPNIPDHDGTTPLHTALEKEYPEAFELLLEYGADPDVPGKDGRTVRGIASRKRDKTYLDALPQPSAAS